MAGRIPQHFIDDLLARADIVEVIDSYVPLRKAGKNYQARCPFHEEKTPSFTVSQDKQFYHCFGCGANGTVIGFLMEHNGLSFVEAVEDLAGRYGLELPREAGYQPEAKQHLELYELLEQAARFYRSKLQHQQGEADAYLQGRGLSQAIMEDYEIGYAPPGWQHLLNALGKTAVSRTGMVAAGLIKARDTQAGAAAGHPSVQATAGDTNGYYDRFRNRIMFPIRDPRGRVIGFGGRALDPEDNAKYLNSPETPLFHKGRELYGLFQARRQKKKPDSLYVVEGYMDVVALAQHGISNVVATLGTAVTEHHLRKLFRVVNRIIFCFDGDNAGKTAAQRSLEITIPLLQEGRQVFFKFMPQGEDPDSFVRQHGAERFCADENTVPLSDFLLDTVRTGSGAATREARGNFLDNMMPFLKKMPDSGLRQLLLQEVANVAQTTTEELRRQLLERPADAPRRARAPRPRRQQGSREQISVLIQYILHRPELAMQVEDPTELSGVSMPGVDFLQELVSLVHSNPEITCAGLLERYRPSRFAARLNELASSPDLPTVEEFDMEREFIDRMEKLKAVKSRQAREELAGSKPSALSEQDKQRLRQHYSKPNNGKK
ncbi:MAG: DNA primase [Gammaproteobacteria bacterium]|nr:DNA primase [Gammaproteobacteria bacterium]MCY4338516.1 DNA primase [Gammaproteobacteria bacterium]